MNNGHGGVWRSPWSANDLLLLIGMWAVGAVLLAVSYEVVSGRARFDDQIGMLSLAVAGLVVGLGGEAIWLLRGQRAVGERCRDLLPMEVAVRTGVLATSTRLVADEGLRFYHRADCPMATGQGWHPAPREVHEKDGRVACGICQP